MRTLWEPCVKSTITLREPCVKSTITLWEPCANPWKVYNNLARTLGKSTITLRKVYNNLARTLREPCANPWKVYNNLARRGLPCFGCMLLCLSLPLLQIRSTSSRLQYRRRAPLCILLSLSLHPILYYLLILFIWEHKRTFPHTISRIQQLGSSPPSPQKQISNPES